MCGTSGRKTTIDLNLPQTVATPFLDPYKFKEEFWPDVHFYDKQWDIIYSVQNDDETFVPAGNMLGKDFVTGFICVWFFISRRPCRVITTSVKDDHLRVLWGELEKFIQTAHYPLTYPDGPLKVNHREITFIDPKTKQKCPLSYMKGMVSEKGEGLSGHHIAQTGDGIPRTLFIGDEASGLANVCYKMATAWMNRCLIIGNCWECENFFKWAVKGRPGTDDKGGNIADPDQDGRYYRRVIRIKAEDSPNVRWGLLEEKDKKKKRPTNTMLTPGVLSYHEYKKRRFLWDPVRQCVGLDADFYEGAEVKLFPPEWLNRAESLDGELRDGRTRKAKTMGVDTAQGGDYTVWTVIDEYGILEQISKKTPDTATITGETLALMIKHRLKAKDILFDAGGGGREHADRLRKNGHKVRTVSFGSPATPELRPGVVTIDEKKENQEIRYSFKNRRAEMYGLARILLNPEENPAGFAIPASCVELRRQLSPLPLWYDEEGRLYLPPKQAKSSNKEGGEEEGGRGKVTMKSLIGRSPDEADSFVLAVYGLQRKSTEVVVGAAF